MKERKCLTCEEIISTPTMHKKYCTSCKAKRESQIVMVSRKKRFPEIEMGVGSGNHSSNVMGENNRCWKTGKYAYRRLVNKERCNRCASTKYLLIHHIDEDRDNNTIENLEVLCKKCHQKIHVKRNEKGQYMEN